VVAGAVCAAAVSGVAGEILTIVLISAGIGAALLLVFLEIGLGEERDLAHEERARRERGWRRLDLRRRARLSARRRPR
jgi:hypothetical protein